MLKKDKKSKNCIIAIESSCDDTAIACIKNDHVVANKVITRSDLHLVYGGIIPELASRTHSKQFNIILKDILKSAKIDINDIDYIAYTAYPGLIGCLHTGKVFAKTLKFLIDKPLIPIDHMLAHAFSYSINNNELVKFPFICLDASGGHTIIYLFNSLNDYLILNETSDDAVGECLDKIGRILNLPYPGGRSLDTIYDSNKNNLKLIQHKHPSIPFSFSGLKTCVKNIINKNKKINPILVGSSALKWCIDDLISKLKFYTNCYDCKYVVIGGGVAANNLLRQEIKKLDKKIYMVEKKYCGDNAAMICNLANLIIKMNNQKAI